MASIDLRPNGTYRIRVSRGQNSQKRRVYETMNYKPKETSPTKIKKEVEKVAYEFEERVKNGLYLTGDKITFEEYIPIWREQWAIDNLTVSGLESYESLLENKVLPKIGNIAIGRIRPTHIQDIVTEEKNKGRKPKTIRRIITAINSVMKYAYDMEVIESNPIDRVRVPKQATEDKLHYFTPEQINTFFEALTKEYPYMTKSHSSKNRYTGETFKVKEYERTTSIPFQWRVYFNLAIMGAFRRGELCAIKWNDINWESQEISIRRAFAKSKKEQYTKTTKTVSGIRTITLPNSSMSLLREWYKQEKELSIKLGSLWKGERGRSFDNNYVFIRLDSGLPISVDTPTHKFQDIIEMYNNSCKNETDKLPVIRLHDLRHTSATLLLSNGTDIETVSHRLGHKHCSVTVDVYAHWLKDNDKTASDILESVLQNKA